MLPLGRNAGLYSAVALASGLWGVGQRTASAAPVPVRDVALMGVTNLGDRTEAWLVNVRNRQRERARPGESAFGFVVKRVGPEEVVLSREGRRYTLHLGEKPVPAAPVRVAANSGIHHRTAPPNRMAAVTAVDSAVEDSDLPPDEAAPRADTALPRQYPTPVTVAPAVSPYVVDAYGNPVYPPGYYPAYPGTAIYPGMAPGYGYPGGSTAYPDWATAYPGTPIPGMQYSSSYPWVQQYGLPVPWDVPFAGWQGAYPSGSPLGVPGNPQTWRRQNGGFNGNGTMTQGTPAATNPQTMRRRTGFSGYGR